MKLTKLAHSCLLTETDDDITIFDPGVMSYAAKLLDITAMKRLDRIVITHAHADHYSEDFVAELVAKFPSVRIITTEEVAASLKIKGITARTTADDKTELFLAPHESMAPLAPLPMTNNIGVHYRDILSHPGDSHHMENTKKILALPLTGPWGSVVEAVRIATKLQPQTIVPIHDWMWNDTWKNDMYNRLELYFNELGITFLKVTDGLTVEIN